jgi:hypothetical protein
MPITLDGTSGITTPGLTNTGTETIVNLTTTGNTILGDASTDTLNVGNGGLVKDASSNLSVTGGLSATGSISGYSGGELRLGSTTSSVDSAVTSQATGSPAMFFDHRGTSNTGYFRWRNGSGGGTTLMTLDAGGNLNFNVAGANINTTPTSLPSSTSIGYSIITSLGEITFAENVTNLTLASVSLPPGVWQITFVAQLVDGSGYFNATACACAITTDSAYGFPIATNAGFRPDHNVMYTAGASIVASSYRGRVMHTRTVTNGTSSGIYGLKGELNAIKVY